jgi:hypothetical protein
MDESSVKYQEDRSQKAFASPVQELGRAMRIHRRIRKWERELENR